MVSCPTTRCICPAEPVPPDHRDVPYLPAVRRQDADAPCRRRLSNSNCDKLFAAGIWPITVATTILKPGGYNRLLQMVEKVEALPYRPFPGTDTQAI